MSEIRDRNVSVRIGGEVLCLAFTEDEYSHLRRAAVADATLTSAYIRHAVYLAAPGLSAAAAAEAARLPPSSWVRIVVLARLGLTSLGQHLEAFG